MRRLSRTFPLLVAALLGAACSVLVACGSGSSDRDLIPAAQVSDMIDQLDTIQASVDRGRCSGVGNQVDALQTQINDLSRKVDAGLRNRLQEGVNNLASIAPPECLERRQATQTQTTTTETTTTPTTPTETTPTQTTPTQTVPTTPETTPTVPPETTPTVPPVTTPEGGATVEGEPVQPDVGGATPGTVTP